MEKPSESILDFIQSRMTVRTPIIAAAKDDRGVPTYRLDQRPPGHVCAQCYDTIPPGRAGRRCARCRGLKKSK